MDKLTTPADEFGTVTKTADIETTDDDSLFRFVSTDDSVDRYGDIVHVDKWSFKNYKKNPIVLFGHSASLPIGTTVEIGVENNKVVSLIRIAEAGTSDFIDTVRKLLKQKILRAVSVGFRPTKDPIVRQDGDGYFIGYEFVGQELLEQSIVSVPANPNAISLAKSMGARQRTLDHLQHSHQRSPAEQVQHSMAQRRRELMLLQQGVKLRPQA